MGPGPWLQIACFACTTPLHYVGNFWPQKLGAPLTKSYNLCPTIGNNYFNDISPMNSPLWCTHPMVYSPLWCIHLYGVLTSMVSCVTSSRILMSDRFSSWRPVWCTHLYGVLTSMVSCVTSSRILMSDRFSSWRPVWCTHLYGVVCHIL